MAPITNGGRLLFNSVPTGMSLTLLSCILSEPGKTTVYYMTVVICLETVVLNGGIMIKTLKLSIDPYMRLKMQAPEINRSVSWVFH